ncbi:hypothetical protein DSO57_1032919 [Entomophthora muscae]|uniref:Uncharacterized protein n=1 Tax=Entomophthora muscae TaxID=34485 RepID=A0ACC2SP75_9FUNG|nr:hypothetical protein DSO57_1032919 [Entomophthora muscae]
MIPRPQGHFWMISSGWYLLGDSSIALCAGQQCSFSCSADPEVVLIVSLYSPSGLSKLRL